MLQLNLAEEGLDRFLKSIHGVDYVILNESPLIFGGPVSTLFTDIGDSAGTLALKAFP
jgi:hypothetical protein